MSPDGHRVVLTLPKLHGDTAALLLDACCHLQAIFWRAYGDEIVAHWSITHSEALQPLVSPPPMQTPLGSGVAPTDRQPAPAQDERHVYRPDEEIMNARLPTPSDLYAEPPLGPLLMLDLAAAVTVNALRAHHIPIEGDFHPGETDEVTTARALARACDSLRDTLRQYRRRVLARLARERTEFPF